MTQDRLIFPPFVTPTVPVHGSEGLYPVHRIFCVGRNYAEHAAEMKVEVDRETPFYFTKPATALVQSGASIPYPPGTSNYHYEMELVAALGREVFNASIQEADDAVYGYACGLDMTRRDLQLSARAKSRPWDLGKAFEQSAVISALVPVEAFGPVGGQAITLEQNGDRKQSARLSDLIFSVPELIAHLSRFYHLGPGDIIFTGTPAGVGAISPGDELIGQIEGLPEVKLVIVQGAGDAPPIGV